MQILLRTSNILTGTQIRKSEVSRLRNPLVEGSKGSKPMGFRSKIGASTYSVISRGAMKFSSNLFRQCGGVAFQFFVPTIQERLHTTTKAVMIRLKLH